MTYNSIMKGLNEAVEISDGKIQGRRHNTSIAPIKEFKNTEIKAIRENLELTQLMFGQLLGVTKKTVEAWEAGINKPNGTAKRFLELLQKDMELPEKYHLISKAE